MDRQKDFIWFLKMTEKNKVNMNLEVVIVTNNTTMIEEDFKIKEITNIMKKNIMIHQKLWEINLQKLMM